MKLIRHVVSLAIVLAVTGCAKSQETSEETVDSGSATAQPTPAPSLDGRTFVVEAKEKGKSETTRDTLIFTGGMFRSTACDPYGFTPVAYTAHDNDGATQFTAVSVSPDEGKMKWNGTVKGTSIQAQAEWAKEGQAAIIYEYNGTVGM